MSDIRTVWQQYAGDLVLAGPDLAGDDGLETAVIISLFTDAHAADGEVPPGAQRRGWWGDAYAGLQAQDRIGSKLWLLARQKQTTATLRRAEAYVREALQWLIDDGVASAVSAAAKWTRPGSPGVLGVAVEIVRSGRPVARYRFERFWAAD